MSQDEPTDASADGPDPEGDRIRRKAASGAGITLAAHLIGRALAFGFRVGATRMLGADAYGLLALAVAVANLAGRFGALGFDRAALRFGAEGHGKRELGEAALAWRASLVVAFLGSTLLAALVWAFAPAISEYFHQPTLTLPVRMSALSIPFIALTNTGAASLQSIQRIAAMVLFTFVIPPAVTLALLGVWSLAGWTDVTWVAIAIGLGWVVAGVGATVETLRASRGVGRFVLRAAVVRYAATVVLVTGTQQIAWYIDRFMLARLGTAADVGTYDVAATLATQLAGVLAALAPAFTAMVGSLFFSEDKGHLLSLYQTATRWTVALTLPMFLGLSFASDALLSIFGDEFREGRWVLVVLAASQVVSVSAGSVGQLLMMTNREGLVFVNNLLVGALNVLGNYLLIPRYGVLGAAISTAASLSIMNVVAVLELWKIHGLQPLNRASSRPYGAALAALAVGGGLAWLLPPGWVGQLVAAGGAVATYALVMVRLGLLPEDEAVIGPLIRRVRRLFGRG